MHVGGDRWTTAWPEQHGGANGMMIGAHMLILPAGRGCCMHLAPAIGADVVAAQPAQDAVLVKQMSAGQAVHNQDLVLVVGHVEAYGAVGAVRQRLLHCPKSIAIQQLLDLEHCCASQRLSWHRWGLSTLRFRNFPKNLSKYIYTLYIYIFLSNIGCLFVFGILVYVRFKFDRNTKVFHGTCDEVAFWSAL